MWHHCNVRHSAVLLYALYQLTLRVVWLSDQDAYNDAHAGCFYASFGMEGNT